MASKHLPEEDQGEDPLDSLLDSALEDFDKPILHKEAPSKPSSGGSSTLPPDGLITEEAIQKATADFEANMRAIMMQQKKIIGARQDTEEAGALGATEAFDMEKLAAELGKFSEAATDATSDSADPEESLPDFQKIIADTMKNLNANNGDSQQLPDEINQLLGGGASEDGGMFPLMQSMLENILSKDIMYPPIKEIVDKYPEWLSKNKDSTEASEFSRYGRQFDIMKQVVDLFESERESDSDETKSKRFESLVDLMQKLQTEGQPPAELAGDPAQNPMNFGSSAGGTMPDISNLLGGMGANGMAGGQDQCSLM